MKALLKQIWRIALITVVGMLGSIIAGLMRYGSSILVPTEVAFSFVAFGFSGAFIFSFYHIRGVSNTISAALLIGAIQFVISSYQMPITYSAVWSFGVNLPVVMLAFIFEKKLDTLKHWKFVVVGIVFGGIFVLLTQLVAFLSKVNEIPAGIFRENFLDGLWMGIGLGIGIEVAEWFIHSLELHKEEKAVKAF